MPTSRRSLSAAALAAAALLVPAASAQADAFFFAGPADGATITDRTPAFSFLSTTLGASFECSVNGAPFTSCTSPKTLSTLPDGANQTFRVRDVVAGNPDPTPTIRTFTVDATAPAITISGPGKTIDATPTFTFSAPADGGAPYTYVCRVDDAPAVPCDSGTYTPPPVALGAHTFSVRGTDGAGNVSTWATHAFARMNLKLDLPIGGKPADPSTPAPAPAPQPGPAPAAAPAATVAPSSTAPAVKPAAKKKPATCAKKKVVRKGKKAKAKAKRAAAKTCAPKKKAAAKKKTAARKAKRRG